MISSCGCNQGVGSVAAGAGLAGFVLLGLGIFVVWLAWPQDSYRSY
jgi:hypothetical protein